MLTVVVMAGMIITMVMEKIVGMGRRIVMATGAHVGSVVHYN